jgi:ketosteroid isomerase-like protein
VVLASFAGETTVYRGHEGVRNLFREVDDAFVDLLFETLEIRDLGDRGVAIGQWRARGRESGIETESRLAFLFELRDGKAVRVWEYLDPHAALKAAEVQP